MKIFVLGAFGFIGKHLCARLHQLGHEYVTDMRYWSDKYDVIINLAAVTHIRNEFDAKMIESNIILTNEVFKRPERIIQASSCSAAHFTNPYAWTKMWAEHLALKHGNAVALRFQNVYGSGGSRGIVWWLMQQEDGARIKVRGPELVRDYVWVHDVVDEIVLNLEPMGPGMTDVMRDVLKRCSGDMTYIDKARILVLLGEAAMQTNFPEEKINKECVLDVGTGIGTQTMDLVNLYQKLSGKTFHIDIEEAGSNEPLSMVANRSIPNFTTLEEGLKKMIQGA